MDTFLWHYRPSVTCNVWRLKDFWVQSEWLHSDRRFRSSRHIETWGHRDLWPCKTSIVNDIRQTRPTETSSLQNAGWIAGSDISWKLTWKWWGTWLRLLVLTTHPSLRVSQSIANSSPVTCKDSTIQMIFGLVFPSSYARDKEVGKCWILCCE